jgi:hypothetical protein
MSKRVHPIKILLDDEEMLAIHRQCLAQDMKPAEVVRRNCMSFMFGILGLADKRRQRNRGVDSELIGTDFNHSGFHHGVDSE